MLVSRLVVLQAISQQEDTTILVALCCSHSPFELSTPVLEELGIKSPCTGRWAHNNYVGNDEFGLQNYLGYIYELSYRASPQLIDAIQTVGIRYAGKPPCRIQLCSVHDDQPWQIETHEDTGMPPEWIITHEQVGGILRGKCRALLIPELNKMWHCFRD